VPKSRNQGIGLNGSVKHGIVAVFIVSAADAESVVGCKIPRKENSQMF